MPPGAAVACRGYDYNGQLGRMNLRFTAEPPGPLAEYPNDASTALVWFAWSKIAAGQSHTCAISLGRNAASVDADYAGSLWCWGLGDQGQLGTNTAARQEVPMINTPVNMPGKLAFKDLVLGGYHTLAVAANGSVVGFGALAACWE